MAKTTTAQSWDGLGLSRGQLVRDIAAGGRAGEAGRPVTACPFRPYTDDPVQKLRGHAWIRGYVRGKNHRASNREVRT